MRHGFQIQISVGSQRLVPVFIKLIQDKNIARESGTCDFDVVYLKLGIE